MITVSGLNISCISAAVEFPFHCWQYPSQCKDRNGIQIVGMSWKCVCMKVLIGMKSCSFFYAPGSKHEIEVGSMFSWLHAVLKL